MVAEELRSAAASLGVDFLEELWQLDRIVAGVIHDVGSEQVSLSFRLPRILQEVRSGNERNACICELSSGAAAQQSPENSKPNLSLVLLRGGTRGVPLDDVRYLMRHYSR